MILYFGQPDVCVLAWVSVYVCMFVVMKEHVIQYNSVWLTDVFLIVFVQHFDDNKNNKQYPQPYSYSLHRLNRCAGTSYSSFWVKQRRQKGRTDSRHEERHREKSPVLCNNERQCEPRSVVLYSCSVRFSMPRSPHRLTVKAPNVSVVLADYTDTWKMRGGPERGGLPIGTHSER